MKQNTILFFILLFIGTAHAQLIVPTGSFAYARMYHGSQLLSNGKVVAFGGYNGNVNTPVYYNSAEKFDPLSGTWLPTGSMRKVRENSASVLLNNGNILVVGGDDGNISFASCEIYNVASGTWSYADSLKHMRTECKAIVLNNGKILAVGGAYNQTCEIYDQTLNKWSAADSLKTSRTGGFIAKKLQNGDILVGGGQSNVAEIYNVTTGKWTVLTNMMLESRDYCNAILMSNGKVLIAGGNSTKTSEIFDASTNTFAASGNMLQFASGCEMINLTNGQVLIFGIGTLFNPSDMQCLQVFDPTTSSWHSAGIVKSPVMGANEYTIHKLPGGKILIAGGNFTTGNGAQKSCYYVTESSISSGIVPEGVADYFNLYPNPARNEFFIDAKTAATEISQISLLNSEGQVIQNEIFEYSSPVFHHKLNLENLSKGLYFVHITSKQHVFVHKILIQ